MSGAKNIKPPYFQALVRTGTDPGLGSYRCRIQQSEIILKPYTKSLPTISIFVNPAQFHMAVASMRSGQADDSDPALSGPPIPPCPIIPAGRQARGSRPVPPGTRVLTEADLDGVPSGASLEIVDDPADLQDGGRT